MFARAIVVELAGFFLGPDHPFAFGRVLGRLRATAPVAFAKSQFFRPSGDPLYMDRAAAVRRRGQRQLFRPQAVLCSRTRGHQGQGLDHLGRGARIDHSLRITPGFDNLAAPVADHRVAPVLAFKQIAAPKLNKCRRLCHDPFSSWLPQALHAGPSSNQHFLPKDGKILPKFPIAHGSCVANMFVSAKKRARSEKSNGQPDSRAHI